MRPIIQNRQAAPRQPNNLGLVRPSAETKIQNGQQPDIPLARCMAVLRCYRANGREDLFEDHLLWMLQNFAWNDDGGFLITREAA